MKLMIHVFPCQSRKETHVEIGEMHVSPILYEFHIHTLQLSILPNRKLDGAFLNGYQLLNATIWLA